MPRRRGRAAHAALACAVLTICISVAAGAGAPAVPSVLGATPPPTPVPPSGSPSPFPTALRTPGDATRPPDVVAPEAILEDLDSGQVLFRKAAETRRPIASLTKVMTALIAIDSLPLSKTVTVTANAASAGGSVLGLRAGERISVRELLYALLLQSSNDAAVALAEAVSGSVGAFVARMNDEARVLHLAHTTFFGPSGLDDRGASTATDLARLTRLAYGHDAFADIVGTKEHDVRSASGPVRHVQNRNVLLWLYRGAVGVKTGFTTPAGHCVIAAARRGDEGLVAVILGDPEDREFDDAAALLNYGFAAFERTDVVTQGQSVGSIVVGGRTVPVVAATTATKLLALEDAASVERTVVRTDGLDLPVAAGQEVGRVVVTSGGRRVTTVRALAAASVSAPQPPPPDSGVTEVGDLRRPLRVLTALAESLFGPFL